MSYLPIDATSRPSVRAEEEGRRVRVPGWSDSDSGTCARDHHSDLGRLDVDEQEVVADRECTVEAGDRKPAAVGGEALDAVPAAFEHAADPAVNPVEDVGVDIDAVSLRRREGDEVPVGADVTEIVLDIVLDHQRPRFTTVAVHKPELIDLVTATIDSNNDVIGTGDIECRGDGLGEKRQLDEIAPTSGNPVHLHAAAVIASDEELLAVRGNIGDHRGPGLQEARQEIVSHTLIFPSIHDAVSGDGSAGSMRLTPHPATRRAAGNR